MKVLIAEDDQVSRRLLEVTLERMDYEVESTENGVQALEGLIKPDAPRLAILDWMMPEMDGVDVCRRIREMEFDKYIYIIFLTAKGQKKDIVTGLEAGADDYLIKPFDPHELRSRLAVGKRILDLEAALEDKVQELESALAHVKTLQGLLPICMYCKDTWHRLESYIETRSDAMFTHSLCQDCLTEHYPGQKQEEPIGQD